MIAPHIDLLNRKLCEVASGRCTRLRVSMPPRHGKSYLVSHYFPAWYLGRHPDNRILASSYEANFAAGWGRKARNAVEQFGHECFGVSVSKGSSAADRWDIEGRTGGMETAGVGGALTGKGADLFIIDDPIKNAEEAASETMRKKTWEWYTSTAYTRLEPGASMIVIQCMTGDTPVLMESGEEIPLRSIRPGDRVATYDGGKVSASTVVRWANNGPDRVFEIRMKSGTKVRANARHPFLVDEGGIRKWKRTDALKKGTAILRVREERGPAACARRTDAGSLPSAKVCATPITAGADGEAGFARLLPTLSLGAKLICGIATGSALKSMAVFSPIRAAFVQSANSLLPPRTPALIGATSFASIIATKAKKSGACSVTTATSQSDTENPKGFSSPPLSTFEVENDTVLEVVDAGVEDVFDVQIERTENFIAGGLVSHNTRWHESDLCGKLIEKEKEPEGEKWDEVVFPAIAEENDILGRAPGEALWPARYPIERLRKIRINQGSYQFSALYQQRPTPEEGGIFKRQWMRAYEVVGEGEDRIYRCEGHGAFKLADCYRFGTMDLAISEKTTADYTVLGIWAVTPRGGLMLLDLFRDRIQGPDMAPLVKRAFNRWGLDIVGIESVQFQEALVHQCRKEGLPIMKLLPRGDKVSRAHAAAVRFEAGLVFFPKQADWLGVVESELFSFPNGAHDDTVDVTSYASNYVTRLKGAPQESNDKPSTEAA